MRNQFAFLGGLLMVVLLLTACTNSEIAIPDPAIKIASDKLFVETMQKHLDAVTNRDAETLRSTLSPDGKMQLLLPQTELMNTVDEFMDYHIEWFKDTIWTFDTKIINTEIGETMGLAVTEVLYREPERNGKPYFNRMHVSYDLKKMNGKWYVIKDQACSIEKAK